MVILLHEPHFYPLACWNIRNSAQFMRLSDCLSHCRREGWLSHFGSLVSLTIIPRGAVVQAVWQLHELCPISNISTCIWIEMRSMYQLALGAMGPRLGVRIVHTLGFHKMTISPHDAVVQAVWQSHELYPFSNISTRIWIEMWTLYQTAFEAMVPILGVRIEETLGFHKITISPRDTVVQTLWQLHELYPFSNISTRIWIEMWTLYQIALGAMGQRLGVRIVETLGFQNVTTSPRDAMVKAVWKSHELCRISNISTSWWIEVRFM